MSLFLKLSRVENKLYVVIKKGTKVTQELEMKTVNKFKESFKTYWLQKFFNNFNIGFAFLKWVK
jgi:hypothetical protein